VTELLNIRTTACRFGLPALFFTAACMAATAFAMTDAAGAELRPFVLPSQARATVPESRASQQPAAVDERVYREFGNRVRNLPKPERDRLFLGFEKQRNGAQQGHRPVEVAHYERLLGILASTR
jgi:hypothetical protein